MERRGGQASAQTAGRVAATRGNLDDLSSVYLVWVGLPPQPKRFRSPLPRRWVAERTTGWLSQSRRMSKDYERLCESSQTMIYAVDEPPHAQEARPYLTLLAQLLAGG